jgi:dTDP-4-dehydrorhamnose 3,5-epimerase
MASLAGRGIRPAVVNDQVGRLTFTEDLAAGILHLLRSGAPFGTYNLTNEGQPQSWADVAAEVFELAGRERSDVTGVSTAEYFRDKAAAPRPLLSTLDLSKLRSTGFVPATAADRLKEYLSRSRQ